MTARLYYYKVNTLLVIEIGFSSSIFLLTCTNPIPYSVSHQKVDTKIHPIKMMAFSESKIFANFKEHYFNCFEFKIAISSSLCKQHTPVCIFGKQFTNFAL